MTYSEAIIWRVWAMGGFAGGNDPVLWRKDTCGAWLFRGDYENRDSEYGWIIDHIKPIADGGTEDISNLRPLHWANNTRRADGSLECKVTSAGIHNDKPVENIPIEKLPLSTSYFFI